MRTPLPRVAAMLALTPAAFAQIPWTNFAKTTHHGALSTNASQSLNSIHWQTPVDLHPPNSGELQVHYGSPLVTAANTVIVPVKTTTTGGFEVTAHNAATGASLWSATSDYTTPPFSEWTPPFGAALTSERLYFAGAGGTVMYREYPDSATGAESRLAFYGLSNYKANPTGFAQSVYVNTPITADENGAIYFGFLVTGTPPLSGLTSGIVRIAANGQAVWVPVTTAASDSTMTQVATNCAPALSQDGTTLYVAVSDGTYGYLVALNSTTLAPMSRIWLTDPKSGWGAWISDNASASPTIGPDGDVYFGVLEDPFPENNDRGWLLHFNSTLSEIKTPGAFGWDDTASVVPASLVASYTGTSEYLVFTKYNNYAGIGTGNGENQIAVLDPNATEIDPVTGVTVMNEVLTILGPTPDSPEGVKEWCINSAAVDVPGKAILANSEDGNLYRWDLTTNTFTESIALTTGTDEAYTPTVIGVDGTVYAINDAILFAVGN